MGQQAIQVKELEWMLEVDQLHKARVVEQHPRDQGKGRKDPNHRHKAQAMKEDMIPLHRHHHRKEAEVRPHLLHQHRERKPLIALRARAGQTHRIPALHRMRVIPQIRREKSGGCGES
jgi:hypothetical protein